MSTPESPLSETQIDAIVEVYKKSSEILGYGILPLSKPHGTSKYALVLNKSKVKCVPQEQMPHLLKILRSRRRWNVPFKIILFVTALAMWFSAMTLPHDEIQALGILFGLVALPCRLIVRNYDKDLEAFTTHFPQIEVDNIIAPLIFISDGLGAIVFLFKGFVFEVLPDGILEDSDSILHIVKLADPLKEALEILELAHELPSELKSQTELLPVSKTPS